MIELQNIEMYYGPLRALKGISFSIDDGNIIGLLGRNGAGKSTLMNVMTGYLPAFAGSISIDGISLSESPLEYKKKIGYLPEKPPLYENMQVEEYLLYVARLRGVPKKDVAQKANEVIEKTGLAHMRLRLIRNLSKGYQQRVGIAQAMVAEPAVLILDEPTVGLDPSQVVEVRALLKEYGKDHIVIVSSHILSEIDEISDRIVIINEGNLVKDCLISELHDAGINHVSVRVAALREDFEKILKDELKDCTYAYKGAAEKGATDWEIHSNNTDVDVRRITYRLAVAHDIDVLKMHPIETEIEDLFLDITNSSKA